ncbi:DUF1538 domain-containing protein [Fusobacterium varium]|uniref:DUF1538 domain-containing protein n=1 Tax=Fusobacterium varium TaxID=856 RepID=UPI000E407CC3|nr:DUF1538 domain-containing protein [Fusobacterium varium]MCI6033536.1 DUF1538 domain-containing protein [Fusobacterium varium]MDY4005679.1 DUF1538 domain-containing protein [Fusobacterium varium]RGJ32062.1 DUF1538 domain-containing protein [Fusobacterium varium]
MNIYKQKFKEVLFSIFPITIIVMILNFTLTPLEIPLIIRFIIGAFLIIIGLSIFLIGVDIAITPLGSQVGAAFAKSNKIWIVIIGGLIVGFFISIAEPGLIILANQVGIVTSGQISSISILSIVSIGLAIMLAAGFVRIVFNIPLYKILTVLYGLVLILALFTPVEFLTIAFDASGATTGILAVPFILALAVGISSMKKDSKASEKDSFGLVAIASVGAIISVMILSIFSGTRNFSEKLEFNITESKSVIEPFIKNMPILFKEGFLTIFPLIIIFFFFQKFYFKMNKKNVIKMIKGFIYAFLGLFLFLVGVNTGFMDIGAIIGYTLASYDNKSYVIIIAFILGVVTILAEPAVYVLTHQIENVTSGYVKRRAILVALAIGVGIAVALSMIRIIVPGLRLWHYLLPGYIISIFMMYFIPKLFVGIAFDAGGVMTTTFILAFTQGVAEATEGASILTDGFGMIATVAMIPIITLQMLGFIFEMELKRKGELKNEG